MGPTDRLSPAKNKPGRTLTYDESNFTGGLLIGAGHHGAHRVVDHGYHIQVKLLGKERDMSLRERPA